MRIALAQLNSTPGRFDATVAHMLDAAQEAASEGADLVIFPTTLLNGVYPLGISAQRAYELDLLDALEDFASRTPVRSVIAAYVNDGTSAYTEVFMCEEGACGPLRLRESGDDGPAPETICPTVSVRGVSVRIVVGDTAAYGQDLDVDVTCILSSMPFCDQDTSTLLAPGLADGALRGLVQECPGWVCVMGGVGAYDDAVLAGGSFAVSPDGDVVATCPSFEEGVATFDVPPRPAADDLDEEYVAAFAPAPATRASGTPLADVPALTDEQRTGFLWDALVLSVRDYVRKSGFSDVIVGLSGGIDSSVVAALAADALGASHVLGVLMPGPYSSASSVTDAADLAQAFGLDTRTVAIGPMYEAACGLYAQALGEPFAGVARENLQARLRGTTLMSLANARGALVLNTGNKSEAGMGYSTLYGDTVGAFAPLSDVYKGRVYDLARWCNGRPGRPHIPHDVLVKAPSAELSEGQTDEGSFGVSYADIDRILSMHVERAASADEIAATGIPRESVERVLAACRTAEFKRRQEPMGPIVSLTAFIDRGWPVVFGWRDTSAARPVAPSAQPEGEDADQDASPVADRLDQMLARFSRQDRLIGMVGDVAFGTSISGRGPDMDDVMGFPLFSKN